MNTQKFAPKAPKTYRVTVTNENGSITEHVKAWSKEDAIQAMKKKHGAWTGTAKTLC